LATSSPGVQWRGNRPPCDELPGNGKNPVIRPSLRGNGILALGTSKGPASPYERPPGADDRAAVSIDVQALHTWRRSRRGESLLHGKLLLLLFSALWSCQISAATVSSPIPYIIRKTHFQPGGRKIYFPRRGN